MKNTTTHHCLKSFALLLAFAVTFSGCLTFTVHTGADAAECTPASLIAQGYSVLELTLDGYQEYDIEKDSWRRLTCKLSFDGRSIERTAQIKGRGNYTWGQPKRPYAIKCDEKTNWFGFGAAKDWVLLANITDQTKLRNYLAFELASKLRFGFTPKARAAHLFINGNYNGLYLITEKVEIDDRRVNISVSHGDVLLELDNNYGYGEPENFSTQFGNLYVVKDPSRDEFERKAAEKGTDLTFDKAVRDARQNLRNFENSITERKTLDIIGKYMDLDTLVDWYIFNEIMKNDDTLFNSSIYLYNVYGDKLYMGPVWDYDLALAGIDRFNNLDTTGLHFLDNSWGRPNWFIDLLNRKDFVNLVKTRWTQLSNQGILRDWLALVSTAAAELAPQVQYDVDVWNNTGVFVLSDNYAESVKLLSDFMQARVSWLNGEWYDESVTPATSGPTQAPTPTPTPGSTPASAASSTPTSDPSTTPKPGGNPTGKPTGDGEPTGDASGSPGEYPSGAPTGNSTANATDDSYANTGGAQGTPNGTDSLSDFSPGLQSATPSPGQANSGETQDNSGEGGKPRIPKTFSELMTSAALPAAAALIVLGGGAVLTAVLVTKHKQGAKRKR
ncbi:MAG: CotH kinase family protein [Clostridia bacterium]|nr:CotH kinase family protein [Clostridia bacterium]